MKILDIYEVKETSYSQKDSLIEYESSSVVESKKIFPVYGNQMFKPLSKTKPLVTPLFAYSEVFWSYYIGKYFEEKTPRYFLAKCQGIEEISKNYDIGTLVFKVTKEDEKLVNLLEYFKENPDKNVNIDNYVNYYEVLYLYTDILSSNIFQKRDDLRHSLENQILLSILKRDENFHYENVSFIVKNGEIISLCPSLDSEFSLMFLYPDKENEKNKRMFCHKKSLSIPFDKRTTEFVVGEWLENYNVSWKVSLDNILKIVSLDPELVRSFISKLDLFIDDIQSTDILFYNNDYFKLLNSDSWKIGYARYKEEEEEKANNLEKTIKYIELNDKKFNETLKQECLDSAKWLKFVLQVLLILKDNNSLDEVTIKKCLRLQDINISREEFDRLSIDEKLNLLNKQKVKKLVND